MSALQGSKDNGEGWMHKVGVALFLFGLGAVAVYAVVGIWFWLIEIVPFFWERGDYLPAIATVAMLSLVVGGVMINSKES